MCFSSSFVFTACLSIKHAHGLHGVFVYFAQTRFLLGRCVDKVLSKDKWPPSQYMLAIGQDDEMKKKTQLSFIMEFVQSNCE